MMRWLPAFAAALGLIGGIGGAYIGGKVANEGQQKQFENQRIAQIQDLLVADYGKYLRAAEVVVEDAGLPPTLRTNVKKTADLVEFSAAEAEVHLVASPELWAAAQKVRASFDKSESLYRAARDAFIQRAQQDVDAAGG
jgi:hypothetical protein